jgi:hypothetical protein
MCQNTEATFLFLRGFIACSKRGTKSPFVLGYRTFDMPTASHHFLDAMNLHFSALRSLGPTSSRVASIKGNYCGADSQFFPAQLMIMFSVVRSVCQEPMALAQFGVFGGGIVRHNKASQRFLEHFGARSHSVNR